MSRLTQKDEQGNWCLKGLAWEQLNVGQAITKKAWEKLYGALWKLMKYEDIGLMPDEVEALNTFDGSQAIQVMALLQEEQRKHQWIPVEERLPGREDWMGNKGKEHYLRRMEIAVMSDTIEYFLVYYDGYKWFDKFGRTYVGVKAWKIHDPFNP